MANRLQGKVAIVTGAGRGIGAAIAHAFAGEGARVIVAEMDARSGAHVADALSAAGAEACFVQTDVRFAEEVEAASATALKRFGGIDVLVNNAGINVFHRPHETDDGEWQRCFAVDLDGVWRMSRAVLPTLRAQQRGTIVNIASTHSHAIIPGCFPYPVAKHAVLGLTRALAVEYAAEGLRVNAIAPGYIDTPLLSEHWGGRADPAAARERTCRRIPARRVGRADEVAMTAVFLASDEATFINGACIVVDGGASVLHHDRDDEA